jgi:hypothetical protein
MSSSIEFDKELHSLYDAKPPISASKMQQLTKIALKHPKVRHRFVVFLYGGAVAGLQMLKDISGRDAA